MFCQKKQRNDGLPPTSDSIRLHIARANYQAMVWKRSLEAFQVLPPPIGNGWELEDGCLKPVFMSQDAAPEGLGELTVCKCQKLACKSASCVCKMRDLSSTEACGYMAENPHTMQTVLSPGQTDSQVVASNRKQNLRRDLRWVAKRSRKFPQKYTKVAIKTHFNGY